MMRYHMLYDRKLMQDEIQKKEPASIVHFSTNLLSMDVQVVSSMGQFPCGEYVRVENSFHRVENSFYGNDQHAKAMQFLDLESDENLGSKVFEHPGRKLACSGLCVHQVSTPWCVPKIRDIFNNYCRICLKLNINK